MKSAVEAIRLFKLLNRDQRNTFAACFLGWTLDAFDFFLLTFVIVPMAHDFGKCIADLRYAMTITLVCDHRILYGWHAAPFLEAIGTRLERASF